MNVFDIINKILTIVQIVMWLFDESIHLKLVYSVDHAYNDQINFKLNHFYKTYGDSSDLRPLELSATSTLVTVVGDECW